MISFFLTRLTTGLLLAGLTLTAGAAPKKVLVVTVTYGFRHSSIATAEKVLAKIGQESGAFTVDFVQQPPNKPNASPPQPPRKPTEPKNDGDDAKFKKALEKYDADLKKMPAAEEKYKTDLAKFKEDEARLKAAAADWDSTQQKGLAKLSPDSLKNYDAVIFANTTGDLPLPDKQGFIDWVKAGHGFVAMHSGSDTFHGYRPYIEMLGGEFETHGAQEKVDCLNKDPQHPATKHFGASFDIGGKKEEIYIIKSYDPTTVHELLVLDQHPNTKKPGHYAMSWCKEFGQGKVFYTSLGHNEYVWEMPEYQQHILGGIKWALGLEKGDATPQAK
jgi:type 1 glutamine amidotransferase